MNTRSCQLRKSWRTLSAILLIMVSVILGGGSARAQKDDPCGQISVSMKYQGDACCWQFVITNNQSAYWISSVMANVLTPGATVTGASGPYGVPTTTSGTILWNFPNNLPPNGAQTGLIGCFNGTGPVTVELIYYSQGRVACRDTVTFDCPQQPQGCFKVAQQKAECITLADGQSGYLITFMVQNQSPWPASSLTLSAPGATFSPTPITFSPALPPGGWSSASVTVTGATAGPLVINGVLCDSTWKRCCEGRFEVLLPKCEKEDCFRIGEQSLLCRYNQNNQIEFVWSFNIFNQASWPASYLSFSAPGITFSPGTVVLGVVAPGSWSPMQTVVISGPGAIPGATITVTVRMCDRIRRQCCEQTLTVKLPDDCKPKDCCSDFRKGVKGSSSASSNGTTTLSGYIGAIGTGGSPITKVEATLASVSINGAPVYGYFQYGTISNPFGTASGTPAPYGHEVIWPAIPAGVPMNMATPFTLKMTLPPLAWPKKRDTIRYCVRFRFTDKNCVTCDTLVCYTTIRNKIIIWDPTHLERGEQHERKGGERNVQSAGEAPSISGALHGADSGSIDITFPAFPEGVPGGAYVGLTIETESANLAEVHAAEEGYEFFVANNRAHADFSAASGSHLSLGLVYDAPGAGNALPHRMTLYYTVAGDTLSEEFTMVLRRDGLAGGDRLAAATSDLRGVRTYVLHLDNSNGSQEPIGRLVIGTEGPAKILAVGPTANDSIVELGFGGGIGEYGAEGMLLAPGSGSGPIYITVAGGGDDPVRIRFATLGAGGEPISTGEVILSNPLSSVQDDRLDAVTGGVMLRQSYPNPASHSATIGFTLAAGGEATLIVTDASGREVARPIDGRRLEQGEHAVYLDTADLPEGSYYYTLRVGTNVETRGMQVVR